MWGCTGYKQAYSMLCTTPGTGYLVVSPFCGLGGKYGEITFLFVGCRAVVECERYKQAYSKLSTILSGVDYLRVFRASEGKHAI